MTGLITTQEFVDSWDKAPDNFASNPPNAVLSIFHPDSVSDIVVELQNPALAGPGLTYTVVILDGEMPAEGGPTALFIDVIGRPLSPVSVAGMPAAIAGKIDADSKNASEQPDAEALMHRPPAVVRTVSATSAGSRRTDSSRLILNRSSVRQLRLICRLTTTHLRRNYRGETTRTCVLRQ